MKNIDFFINEMIKIYDKIQKELNERGNKANKLISCSEEICGKNKEQWEAYLKQIEYEHTKMISLIHDLLVIENVLETIERR